MIELSIVTPEGLKYSGDVKKVAMPAANGEIEIHPGHIPFISTSEPGFVTFTDSTGKESVIIVDKGFIQIDSDSIKILVEDAKLSSEIDKKEVEKKVALLEKELTGQDTMNIDYQLKEKELKYYKALIEEWKII